MLLRLEIYRGKEKKIYKNNLFFSNHKYKNILRTKRGPSCEHLSGPSSPKPLRRPMRRQNRPRAGRYHFPHCLAQKAPPDQINPLPLHSFSFFTSLLAAKAKPSKQIRPPCPRPRAPRPPPPAMVGVAAGFAFAPAVSRAPYRPGATCHASGPSSSARFPSRPWARARAPARLVVVARYSSSYEGEDEEEEDEEELGGGGWGRRDRGPDPDYDPALDIERIEYTYISSALNFVESPL